VLSFLGLIVASAAGPGPIAAGLVAAAIARDGRALLLLAPLCGLAAHLFVIVASGRPPSAGLGTADVAAVLAAAAIAPSFWLVRLACAVTFSFATSGSGGRSGQYGLRGGMRTENCPGRPR